MATTSTAEKHDFIEENEFLTDYFPVHPGIILKLDVLPARKVTGRALAAAIRATQPSIAKVLNGKGPVTPNLAARIEAAIGYPADLLCSMQVNYDLAEVRRENAERLKDIPRIAVLA
ncbi:HigA family addiction module antitoxin [Novosphingobium sp. KA1]|uniref:HigA family addiction module antitoxin n=1 Tax=Novosphingobium sp. (strain KA1) TaxID=164608 RepID=UPI001A8F9CCA|nr:HigA family addiction module antitoxin [Novosphingobium sp. KA1]QSR16087.1 addiction module antidote protein, HigA family [Novosphingobium sp. KA1]